MMPFVVVNDAFLEHKRHVYGFESSAFQVKNLPFQRFFRRNLMHKNYNNTVRR